MEATAADLAHILVVDDDPMIRDTLRDCLEGAGYRVSEAEDKAGLLAVLAQDPVDLITLDLRLKAEDGLDIARHIRTRSNVPIILLTGVGEPVERALGLEAGADDYVTKPFHLRELLARVSGVLRRARRSTPAEDGGQGSAARFHFDGWVLDRHRRSVRSPSGGIAPLTGAEFDLLELLLHNANRVLSRNQIMDLLKGPQWVANDRVIDNRIGRLRRKMAGLGAATDMIKSIRGSGYILSAKVSGTE